METLREENIFDENMLNGFNGWLHISGKKISELEDTWRNTEEILKATRGKKDMLCPKEQR